MTVTAGPAPLSVRKTPDLMEPQTLFPSTTRDVAHLPTSPATPQEEK